MSEAPPRARLSRELTKALREGPAGPATAISSPAELRSTLRRLRETLNGDPRLARLWLANPQRTLRALGLSLSDEALARFNALRERDGWRDDNEAYERFSQMDAELPDPDLLLHFEDEGALRGVDATERSLSPDLLRTVDRWRDLPGGSSSPLRVGATRSPGGRGGGGLPDLPRTTPPRTARTPPPPPPSGTPTQSGGVGSHLAPFYPAGTTGNWDVVLQMHETLLRRFSEVFFAAQWLGSLVGGSRDTPYVDHRYTFEGWLLKFLRLELTFEAGITSRVLTFQDAEDDEVGIRMRVQVVASSRWTPSSEWQEDDRYTADLVRYGKLTRSSSLVVGEETLSRLFTADLAGGRTLLTIPGAVDKGREDLLGAALNAYFTDELPHYPVTFETPSDPPFMTWPRAKAFCRRSAPDLNALTVCFGDHGGAFRSYILHHGRNTAVGISDPAVTYLIREGLPRLPHVEEGVTIESWDVGLRDGHVEVTARGFRKMLFKVSFTYKAEITLSIRGGELVGEIDRSRLNLPAWLWFLSSIFLILPGIVITAVAGAIGKGKVNESIGDRLGLDELTEGLFAPAGNDLFRVVPEFDRVEVNPNGLFLRGNVLVNP